MTEFNSLKSNVLKLLKLFLMQKNILKNDSISIPTCAPWFILSPICLLQAQSGVICFRLQ